MCVGGEGFNIAKLQIWNSIRYLLENVSVIDIDGVDMNVVVDNPLVVWYPSVVGNVVSGVVIVVVVVVVVVIVVVFKDANCSKKYFWDSAKAVDNSTSPDSRTSLYVFISDVTDSKSSSLQSKPLLHDSKSACDLISTIIMFCSVADILSKFAGRLKLGRLKLALLLLVKLVIVLCKVWIADQRLHIDVLAYGHFDIVEDSFEVVV